MIQVIVATSGIYIRNKNGFDGAWFESHRKDAAKGRCFCSSEAVVDATASMFF